MGRCQPGAREPALGGQAAADTLTTRGDTGRVHPRRVIPTVLHYVALTGALLFLLGLWYPLADPRVVVWWFSASDFSWAYVVNRAAALGLSQGSDILSTWGPLAHLLVPLDIGAHAAQSLLLKLAVNGALAVLVSWVLIRLGAGWLALGFYGALLIATGLLAGALLEYQLPFLVLLALLASLDAANRVLVTALCSVLAVTALLMKLTMGLACLSAVATFGWLQWREGRLRGTDAALLGATPVTALAVLFPLTGSRPMDLGRFLSGSLEIAAGYPGAYGIDGPVVEAALAVCPALGVVWIGLRGRGRHLRYAAWLSSIPLLIALKHGFVRHDVYHMLYALGFLWLVGALLIAGLAMGREHAVRDVVAVGVVCGLIASAWLGVGLLRLTDPSASQWIFLVRQGRALAENFPPRGYVETVRENQRAAFRQLTLPEDVRRLVQGQSVDIVPRDAAYAQANGLRWQPRPVFPSDNVSTQWLDDVNARHFVGPSAPRFVLYEFKSIDGRHPFFDEPRTWRELACRYTPQLRSGPILVLERSARGTCHISAPFREVTLKWGQALVLPDDQRGLVVSVDVRRSVAGEIVGAAFRPPLSFLDVEYADGVRTTHRLVEATARNGLMLGGLPREVGDVEQFLLGVRRHRVTSIRFVHRGAWAYTDSVRVSMARLSGGPFR